MELDFDHIKKHYGEMSDEALAHIAQSEIASLRPEVQPYIIAEVKRRNLDSQLLSAIAAQQQGMSESELFTWLQYFQSLPCPECGQDDMPLMGGFTYSVRSFIIFTRYRKRIFIGCEDCLSQKQSNTFLSSLMFGIWGFPWGIIRTIQVTIRHFTDVRKKEVISDEVLKAVIQRHIGTLTQYGQQPPVLTQFIVQLNSEQ